MEKIMQRLGRIVVACCAVMCLATALSAADAMIHGVITDTAGKPVRGAIVKVTAGSLSVSAYSQNDGRFEGGGSEFQFVAQTRHHSSECRGIGWPSAGQPTDTDDPRNLYQLPQLRYDHQAAREHFRSVAGISSDNDRRQKNVSAAVQPGTTR